MRAKALTGFLVLAALLVVVSLWPFSGGAGAAFGGLLTGEPAFGSPAQVLLGAPTQGAPGELWATGRNQKPLTRFTEAGGWETVFPLNGEGHPIEGMEPGVSVKSNAGRTIARGGLVYVGEVEGRGKVFVAEPGGPPREAPEPPEELTAAEEFPLRPIVAAFEAEGGATRAFVTHLEGPAPLSVFSDLKGTWTREPICAGFEAGPACALPGPEFRVIEIEAAQGVAWMLGYEAGAGEGLSLFEREPNGGEGGEPVWRQQELGPAGSLGALLAQTSPAGTTSLAPRVTGQPLTVSSAGVWFDGVITDAGVEYDATAYFDAGKGEVTASWCDLATAAGLCTYELGGELPAVGGRSFAWPPGGAAEPYGRRAITGVGEGAMLELSGSAFARLSIIGGGAGGVEGAALSGPEEGWLGAEPPVRLTRTPQTSNLQPWPVPFRRPLTAIAAAPGTTPGAIGSEALAVGAGGQVARYFPGRGWEPEFLLSGSGKRATPTLKAVAWPEPGRAFAVGDNGAMWIWQKATELWSPDPAAPPGLVGGNFTGIAFDPAQPSRGYAVGKQGLLLGYGRTWTQEALPAGVPAEANFSSVAFAGNEAIATWRFPVAEKATSTKAKEYEGGVIVNEGAGWRVETGAAAVLGKEVPVLVAGLTDGGAVIATENTHLLERESAASPWAIAAAGELGYFPVALAALREGGVVRAMVSVSKEKGEELEIDGEQVVNQPGPGRPPLLTSPYKLPTGGFVLRQTADGWRDEQHQVFPLPRRKEGTVAADRPATPDPLLAILANPSGSEGWVVGGETGTGVLEQGEAIQTADVMRFGTEALPASNFQTSPIAATPGTATFAVAGDAQCAGACAELINTGIAPDRWTESAVGKAAGIAGIRGFLYAGPGVASGPTFAERLGATLEPAAFQREEDFYASRLDVAAGAMPIYAAPTETDIDGAESLGAFQAAFAGYQQPLGASAPAAGVTPLSDAGPGKGYYSFTSSGAGGVVRVIVLDYSFSTLGETQRCWLADQLSEAGSAHTPAIVMGDRDLGGFASNKAEDAAEVVPILTTGAFPAGCAAVGPAAAASAYFFNYPGQNRDYTLSADGATVPAFGSGTLGYVAPPLPRETDFVGAGGFLLAAVNVAARNPATNVAPVSARLIPDVGSLAINALDGTLLRRSSPALFEALARRPLAGSECTGNGAPRACESLSPDPYVPIPTECRGERCATGIFPEYSFTSSRPDIADFVEPDPASENPRAVFLVNKKTVPDAQSGLLCAFNSGTTTVTVTAGGFSYSEKVTVLAGSVQQPCGTVPLKEPPTIKAGEPTPTTPLAPAPAGPAPSPSPAPPPPPPVVPAPVVTPTPPAVHAPPAPHVVKPAPPVPIPTPYTPTQPASTPLVPFVPPPPTPAFQPTPPSGTSPISAVEKEEEEEEAYESSSAYVAVRPHSALTTVSPLGGAGGGGSSRLVPMLALLAAIGAVGVTGNRAGHRRRRRPDGRRNRPAYQSNSNSWRSR